MKPEELLDILGRAEKLKCNTRHCVTSTGRPESVAEHSWRLALMAMLLGGEEEYRDLDMNKVIQMCLIHDLGEAFTGDIPTFEKKEEDRNTERELYDCWVDNFPEPQRGMWKNLLSEMEGQKSREAKLYKALDKLEAVIAHNESDIKSWLPLEYELQLTYGAKEVMHSAYLQELKKAVDAWTRRKIASYHAASQDNDI